MRFHLKAIVGYMTRALDQHAELALRRELVIETPLKYVALDEYWINERTSYDTSGLQKHVVVCRADILIKDTLDNILQDVGK